MPTMTRAVAATIVGAVALVIAVVMTTYVALAPLIPKRVVTVSGTTGTVQTSTASLLEAAGWPIIAALAVIVAVAAAPLLVRTRWAFLTAAATLAVISAVTWSTVGPYLLTPAVVLLIAGVVAQPRATQALR